MESQSRQAMVEEMRAQLARLELKYASELEHGASNVDDQWHVVTPSVVAVPLGSTTEGDQSTSQNHMAYYRNIKWLRQISDQVNKDWLASGNRLGAATMAAKHVSFGNFLRVCR